MAITITRTAWTDDDGTGITGTVVNNAEKTALYNQIDAALALLLPLAGGTLTGGLSGTTLTLSGTLAVTGATTLAAAVATTLRASSTAKDAISIGDGTARIGQIDGIPGRLVMGITTGGIRVVPGATTSRVDAVDGSSNLVTLDLNTWFTVSGAGALRGLAYGAGTATFDASGNITSSSDERMKDIEGAFAPGLKAVLGIKPIRYRWKKDTGLDVDNVYAGFSAQNILGVVPEAIGKQNDRYSMNIVPVLAAVVNAIQELATEADELRAKAGLAAVTRTMPVNTSEARIVDSARVKKAA